MRRKHGLLLFIASCIPGCGEMYQGYMKRGISILWPSDHSNFSGSGRFGGTAAADLDVLLFRQL